MATDLEAALAGVDRVLAGQSQTALAALFAPSFLAQVPTAHLETIFGRIHQEVGPCTGHEVLERPTENSARVRWHFERGHTIEGAIGVSEQAGGIVFLNFGLPSRPSDTWDDLRAAIAELPGSTSFELRALSPPAVLAAHEPDRVLGVGSSSKLVILTTVLDAVAEGSRRWEDLLRLDPRHFSAPSGIMHTWPAGSPLTVHTAAVLLMSLSDNTAADLLLDELGRDRVEGSLDAIGIGQHRLLRPFLSTRALFRLVTADTELRSRYVEAGREERLAMLGDLQLDPPMLEKLSSETWPPEFDWCFSAREMNDLLARLAGQVERDPVGRAVLGMNLEPIAAREWRWVGFKGGSSPGRLCLAALLEAPDGRRVAATLVSHAGVAALRADAVASLFRRATDLALAGHSRAN